MENFYKDKKILVAGGSGMIGTSLSKRLLEMGSKVSIASLDTFDKFRKHFDYDVEKASDEAVVVDQGVSLTVQSMAEDADINVMMSRFGIGDKMPVNPRVPVFGDFSGVGDYKSALAAVS